MVVDITIDVATTEKIVLLHGGEGWLVGDTVTVTLDSAAGGADTNGNGNATYTIRVVDHERTTVKANLSNWT